MEEGAPTTETESQSARPDTDLETEPQSPAGEPSGIGDGRVEIESVPIPIRELPRPPPRMDTETPSADGKHKGHTSKLLYQIPSRICKYVFGWRSAEGIVRLGFLSRRYPNRQEELILEVEECEFLDEAFSKPILELIKLLGLSSDELFMIVVGVTILLPRGAIALDEEVKKNKDVSDILKGVHPT